MTENKRSEDEDFLDLLRHLYNRNKFEPTELLHILQEVAAVAEKRGSKEGKDAAYIARRLAQILETKFVDGKLNLMKSGDDQCASGQTHS